jgi:hypothetical protein
MAFQGRLRHRLLLFDLLHVLLEEPFLDVHHVQLAPLDVRLIDVRRHVERREPTGGRPPRSTYDDTLLTTTMIGLPTKRAPTQPGEMLNEEFLKPLAIKQKDAAGLIPNTARPRGCSDQQNQT